jgi:hypothetical protein
MNLLLSYVYRDKITPIELIKKNESKLNILLDSGAYSAFKSDVEVDFEEYCAYVKNPPFKIWRYFALDKIGNAKVTERNLSVMLDKGLKPIPVFQRSQSIDRLYQLLDEFDLVGIGGVAGTNDRDEYLKWILERPDIDKRKLHLLGVLNIDLMRKYKPYSCDSSILINSIKFGRIQYFDASQNKIRSCNKETFLKNRQLMAQIKNYPRLLEGLIGAEGWRGCPSKLDTTYMAFRLSIIAAKVLERHLQAIGTKLFLINPNCAPLNIIMEVV